MNLLDDDAAQQVSNILSDARKTTETQTSPSDDEAGSSVAGTSTDYWTLPVTMVTSNGSHQVTADEVMAATDRTERHDATAVGTEETEASDTATDPDMVAEPFDWNAVDALNAGIRDWYVHEFPGDPEGGISTRRPRSKRPSNHSPRATAMTSTRDHRSDGLHRT